MRKFNIIAAITILSASMLTGCGKEIKEYNDSYIVASVKNGDSKLDYATASTYLRIMQAQTYDYVQNQLKEEKTTSDDIWNSPLSKDDDSKYNTYGEQFKGEALSDLETMLISEERSEDYNVKFTDNDEKKCDEIADTFIEKTGADAVGAMHASKESVVNMLKLMTYESRVKEKIQEKADLNIDEDEYNQTTFSYTTVYKDSFEDVEKTAKNITETYEKDNDFDAAVATEGLTAESVTFTTKKPEYKEIGLGKTIIKNSLKLKDGECSSYEDKDGNIVILYMKAVKDESESNSKKSELENQKKSDYYNDTIKKLKKDTKIKVDEDAWDSIKVSKKEIYTSMKDADNDADDTSNESNDSSNKAVIGGDDSSIDVDVTASDGGVTNAEITSGEGDSQEDKDGESDKATDDKNIAEQDDSETK